MDSIVYNSHSSHTGGGQKDCTPLFPALSENSLLMIGAPVFVVSSFVLNAMLGVAAGTLALPPACTARIGPLQSYNEWNFK